MTATAIAVNATERGTIIHKLMEFMLKEDIGYYDCEVESNKADYEYSQIEDKITDEMIEVAEHATVQVLDIYDWYRRRDPTTYLVSEGHVHWATGQGIPDAYIVTQDYVHVIELKTGNNYNIHNPGDEIYRGYSAGILSLTGQEKEEIRVTVINGFDFKTIDEPYTGEQIEYWHREQQRQLDFKSLTEKESGSLPLSVEELAQLIISIVEDNPELITVDLLDAVDRIARTKTPLFNKAKEQVLDGVAEYEGYELVQRQRSLVHDEKLIDYLVEKEGMDRKLFKAFKPHKGNISDNFDAEVVEWVDSNNIFERVDAPGFNFRKK